MTIELKRAKKALLFLAIMAIAFVCNVLINSAETKYYCFAAITFGLFILSIINNPLSATSPYFIFLLVIFLYNCGQIWLNLFGLPIVPGSYTIDRFPYEYKAESILFFIAVICVFNATFFLKARYENKYCANDNTSEKIEKPSSLKVARVLFIVLLAICIIYDFRQYGIARVRGYAAALYARADSELLYMANCAFPFSVFWLLRLEENRKKRVMLIAVALFRYGFTALFIGYRMQAIAFLLCVVVLMKKPGIKINKAKETIFLIGGLLLAAVVSVVAGEFRHGTILSTYEILNSYSALVQELGETFIDLPILLMNTESIGTVYGLSYLCGILYLIPFIGHLIPGLRDYTTLSAILTTKIRIYSNSSLGGSMLAEMFYNFRWFSIVIVAPLIGLLVSKICDYSNERRANNFSAAMMGYILFALLLYVRGNVGEVSIYFRCVVYLELIANLVRSRNSRFST